MFTKDERSSFKYWFAHWCAFQMTALNLKAWKIKYIFHDIEKPWLRLFFSYKAVQSMHRSYSKHHLEYKYKEKIDWEQLVIDWECSRFTKESAPLTAFEEMERKCRKYPGQKYFLESNIIPVLNKFNLNESLWNR